jgi:hypothetical protein
MHHSTHPTSFQAETGLPKILLTLLMSSLLPTSDCMYLFEGDRCPDIPEYAVHLATGTGPLQISYVASGIVEDSFLYVLVALLMVQGYWELAF